MLAENERVAEAHNNLAWLLADRDFDPHVERTRSRLLEMQSHDYLARSHRA